MDNRSFLTSVLSISLLSLLFIYALANAAPMPPSPVVNHQTRQCAIITPGDECGDVILPAGWEYLDEAAGEGCPEGYASIELYPEWAHFKVSHCCTEGHSGVSGDCQDVVIDQSKQRCAFVDDIQACTGLPNRWEAWGENCPTKFEWVDDVVCTGSQTGQTPAPTPPAQIEPTPTSPNSGSSGGGGQISTPTSRETPEARNPLLPCSSAGMLFVAIAGMAYRRKR